ncbi:LacI family DNA-binding transcriptional regulator [Nakamurella flavida]|uniref:LacI family DNA-binding transcriptional regulator n=1 Tax=Nakamurella flavida TaxID=363630 RepID=A0A938YQX6_9ACTN|nr:LacI family DNA-binding transcriptional regulator [Nakamurella flavida]MBM9477310.1 LacI family DNA-binding transcriptional regulator [Nakamurella flavida]MDP9779766.1 DNA-binding LacI/PurR family transcriptional regulator [Nakamurella flavida]
MTDDRTTQSRRPTIYDVAARAGVSKSLVSLVLQRSPRVSEPRRTAVLAAITELGYRPSEAATALAGARTRTVELLIDTYRNLSFVGLVEGIRRELDERDFRLTVTEMHQPGTAGPATWSTAVDGRILAGEPTAGLLAGWAACPIVVAGHRLSVPAGSDVVASDDRAGARAVTEHLLGLGHTTIAHLTGSGGAAQLRREGYEQAVHAAGLPASVAGRRSGTAEQDGYDAAHRILTRRSETTAIVAANDLMALGALAAARDLRRAVPADLSVFGYDDSPLARSRYLSLSSVDDRSTEVGARAARVLLARMDDPDAAVATPAVLPVLVPRGTSGRPGRPPVPAAE